MLANLLAGLTLAIGQVEPASATPGVQFGSPIAVAAPGQIEPGGPAAPGVEAMAQVAPPAGTPKETIPVPPTGSPAAILPAPPDLTAGNGEQAKPKEEEKSDRLFPGRFFNAYKKIFTKKEGGEEEPAPERRGLPEPWSSPPFPGHEYQGYPLIGVPKGTDVYPLMEAIYGGPGGDWIKNTGIKLFGWVTISSNWSTNKNSNAPMSYWVVPNRLELDQLVFRLEREIDTVQTDHWDVGFRSTVIYGEDYRYTTAGGWGSDQLLHHNLLYGWDPLENYIDIYNPHIMEGLVLRIGRWVACPDIETQLAPDNYLGSHSILFTYDTYTQTGFYFTLRPQEQWLIQAGLDAGNDMAVWYQGAVPCLFLGLRWVSKSNNDALYTCLNQLNDAKFSHFNDWGLHQPAGHDNFNYIVTTWEHRFSKEIHTKTEAYYMWERNAEVGGTPSLGPIKPFGGGGGDGTLIPGMSHAYGVLNYTMFGLSKNDYFTVRNEWWRDDTGFRAGFPGNYTSHTIGLSHNFNSVIQVRPEVGYYRDWDRFAFDNGTRKGAWIAGFDFTFRF